MCRGSLAALSPYDFWNILFDLTVPYRCGKVFLYMHIIFVKKIIYNVFEMPGDEGRTGSAVRGFKV